MKALKNDSTIYVGQITSAIADCYRQNVEPTDAELMALYSVIGKNLCAQGEKAFVVHLAEQLSQQFPTLKGFSPRNLRRMRDFYRAYENSFGLMANAQTLSWTQNTVILECCETNEQRTFYISLAAEQSLSKLALMKAIEEKTFEAAKDDKTAAQNVTAACAAVSDADTNQTVNTAQANKTTCGALVTACEPFRQGERAPRCPKSAIVDVLGGFTAHCVAVIWSRNKKWSRPPASEKPLPLLANSLRLFEQVYQKASFDEWKTIGKSPPLKWRYAWKPLWQRQCFAQTI